MSVDWDLTVDFVSVGSGMAGAAAALAAADVGLEAIIVEKSELLGGSAAHSYGILWVPVNHLEGREGVDDSPEQARRYLLWLGAERQSLEHVDAYLRYAPEALEYFERVGGIQFYPIKGLSDHFYPVGPGTTEFGRCIQVRPFEAAALGGWQPLLRHSMYVERVTWEEMARWGGRNNERNWDHTVLAERQAKDIRTFGAGLVGSFLAGGLRRGVKIFNSTLIQRLVVEDDRVVGLECTRQGERFNVRARHGVLLGTGLYGANPRLVTWFDEFAPMPTHRAPSATQGDGLVLAMEHGAAIHIQHGTLAIHLSYAVPGETDEGIPVGREVGLRELAAPHTLLVNRAGERFGDESFFEDIAIKLRQFDLWRHEYVNRPCFLIFDQAFWDTYALEPNEPGGPVPDWLTPADSLQELGSKLGVDGDRLAATVERFNAFADQGRDGDFHRGEALAWVKQVTGDLTGRGKNPNLGPVRIPPFYGLNLFPSDAREAGLVTNAQGQVIHVRGRAIPGLYACGEVAAQLHVGVGYQAGFTLTGAMTFGYRAAHHATGA
ncbi:MAG TPA: FAD-dependent oxidoreductase [Chloroflexota bacterium]|nr:FAD-dependent oxidoreductase [Chloroflexota bacterium]